MAQLLSTASDQSQTDHQARHTWDNPGERLNAFLLRSSTRFCPLGTSSQHPTGGFSQYSGKNKKKREGEIKSGWIEKERVN